MRTEAIENATSKDATNGAPGRTRSKNATSNI